MTSPHFLLADIGGTHSRLALADGAGLIASTEMRFRNDDVEGPTAMLQQFARSHEEGGLMGAVVAAAGPVRDQRLRLTNRPGWHLSLSDIGTALGLAPDKVRLINDLQAMGYALAVPAIAGSPLSQPRLVLAIGTGVNAAVAHPVQETVFVPAQESGYLSLPFTTPEDAGIAAELAAQFGAPAVEAALSGAGLVRVHRLITGRDLPPEAITALPADAPSLRFILRLLGATLGSLALAHLPRGGIYLAGSVGRALARHLDNADFRQTYLDRGPYRDLVAGFPLHVIASDVAPLHGAALLARQSARS